MNQDAPMTRRPKTIAGKWYLDLSLVTVVYPLALFATLVLAELNGQALTGAAQGLIGTAERSPYEAPFSALPWLVGGFWAAAPVYLGLVYRRHYAHLSDADVYTPIRVRVLERSSGWLNYVLLPLFYGALIDWLLNYDPEWPIEDGITTNAILVLTVPMVFIWISTVHGWFGQRGADG